MTNSLKTRLTDLNKYFSLFYRDAVRHFTAGLFADPTYTRALLCRAEAYTQLGNVCTTLQYNI